MFPGMHEQWLGWHVQKVFEGNSKELANILKSCSQKGLVPSAPSVDKLCMLSARDS